MKFINTLFVISALAGAVLSSPAPVSENLEYRAVHELEKRGCVSKSQLPPGHSLSMIIGLLVSPRLQYVLLWPSWRLQLPQLFKIKGQSGRQDLQETIQDSKY
ncbi:hypothetical protein PMZ80_001366 [Knufia obscura]|uniref:Uncharacterized protein n=1 Tax=Knufia obscura TaxID=1635080 RepID=A0ABR0S2Z5_9EURO|nr:hypothetical protein PMZ80_001366 [Knufia obscura]